MNKNTSTNVSGGIGFTGLLTIVFIVLKLVGVIDWSWMWVLAPLWISAIIVVVIVVVGFIVMYVLERKWDKEERMWKR